MLSWAEFWLTLAFGFVSSLHCVQMCGPIVLTYSVAANTGEEKRSLMGLHLAYNAGRTLTYMLLGALLGLLGGAMSLVGSLAGIENIAAMIAGIAMVVTGLVLVGFIRWGNRWRGFAMPQRLLRPVGKMLSSRAPGSKFALGALMGFLPCGLIYAALMKALGTQTPLAGALTMLAFGMGTSGALIAVGIGASAITKKVARWGTAISAVTVTIMGVLLIARGSLAGPVMHCHMQSHMQFTLFHF